MTDAEPLHRAQLVLAAVCVAALVWFAVYVADLLLLVFTAGTGLHLAHRIEL